MEEMEIIKSREDTKTRIQCGIFATVSTLIFETIIMFVLHYFLVD